MLAHPFENTLRAYNSLSTALAEFNKEQPEQSKIDTAIQRGYFLPEEDDSLWSLVSRFLTIRHGFWEIINEMSSHFSDDIENVKSLDDWRFFLVGYASSCQVVLMARLLVEDLAKDKLVQRKINEGSPQNRISRVVYTEIFESLSDTDNAIKIQYMMNFVEANRPYIESLASDDLIGPIVDELPRLETALHPSQMEFIKLRFQYLWHAIARRFAVSKQTSTFFILEKAGRVIAEIGDHEKKRVTDEIKAKALSMLEPGDVLVTRHDFVASNLFLPGYWPHAALFLGTEGQRQEFDFTLDDETSTRLLKNYSTLEAKKDGVLFRSLNETLSVDEFIILRPSLSKQEVTKGLERVCRHEGKGYNFDFDFFRSDQLVCTEVVYRAFDGLADIQFNLIERAGRFSLSAEDILDMALENKGFSVIAAYGFDGCSNNLAMAEEAHKLVKLSY